MSPAVFTRAAAHQPGCSPGCSPTPWVLNSKVMVPTAPRKTHSHVPKHLLDTSAASWSTRQGCDPSVSRGHWAVTPLQRVEMRERSWPCRGPPSEPPGHRGTRQPGLGTPRRAGLARRRLQAGFVAPSSGDVAGCRRRPGSRPREGSPEQPRDGDAPGPATPPCPGSCALCPHPKPKSRGKLHPEPCGRSRREQGHRDRGGWSFWG